MYYCTLKKIESTHNNLRTEVVQGLVPELPVVGKSLFMYSKEILTPNTNVRHILTSRIKEVTISDKNGDIVFRTENSLYELTNIVLADPIKEGEQVSADNE